MNNDNVRPEVHFDDKEHTGNPTIMKCMLFFAVFIAAVILLTGGVAYLHQGETEFIKTGYEMDRIKQELHEYPSNQTADQLVQKDMEISYTQDIKAIGGALEDKVFGFTADALKMVRVAQVFGPVETKTEETDDEDVVCMGWEFDSESSTLKKRVETTKSMPVRKYVHYSYEMKWTNAPTACENTFGTHVTTAKPTGEDLEKADYTSEGTPNCEDLEEEPVVHTYYTALKGEDIMDSCKSFSDFKFQSPCTDADCSASTDIMEELGNLYGEIPAYSVGIFPVYDRYIFDKYMELEPKHEEFDLKNVDVENWTCCNPTPDSVCKHLHYHSPDDKDGAAACARKLNPKAGDQKVSVHVYPGEEISVCTLQKADPKTAGYTLSQMGQEGEEEDFAKEFLEVDLDIVSKDAMGKDECVKAMSQENLHQLESMRYVCFGVIVGGMCLFFFGLAVLFDMFTDAITFIPEIFMETYAAPCGCGQYIQHFEDCCDCCAYCCCSFVGTVVGVVFYFFIFSLTYVYTRGDKEWLLFPCAAGLMILCLTMTYFTKRVFDDNHSIKEQKVVDMTSTDEDLYV